MLNSRNHLPELWVADQDQGNINHQNAEDSFKRIKQQSHSEKWSVNQISESTADHTLQETSFKDSLASSAYDDSETNSEPSLDHDRFQLGDETPLHFPLETLEEACSDSNCLNPLNSESSAKSESAKSKLLENISSDSPEDNAGSLDDPANDIIENISSDSHLPIQTSSTKFGKKKRLKVTVWTTCCILKQSRREVLKRFEVFGVLFRLNAKQLQILMIQDPGLYLI